MKSWHPGFWYGDETHISNVNIFRNFITFDKNNVGMKGFNNKQHKGVLHLTLFVQSHFHFMKLYYQQEA